MIIELFDALVAKIKVRMVSWGEVLHNPRSQFRLLVLLSETQMKNNQTSTVVSPQTSTVVSPRTRSNVAAFAAAAQNVQPVRCRTYGDVVRLEEPGSDITRECEDQLQMENKRSQRKSLMKGIRLFFEKYGFSTRSHSHTTIYCGTHAYIQFPHKPIMSVIRRPLCRCLACVTVSGVCALTRYQAVDICGTKVMVGNVAEAYNIAMELLRMQGHRIDDSVRVMLFLGGRELVNEKAMISDYGSNGIVTVKFNCRLRGGSSTSIASVEDLEDDSDEEDDDTFMARVTARFTDKPHLGMNAAVSGQYVARLLEKNQMSIKFLEDVLMFIYHIYRSRDMKDKAIAVANFVKLRTGKSLVCSALQTVIMAAVNYYFKHTVQGASFKEVIQGYAAAKKSPLCQKIHKFSLMVIGASIFDKIGMKIEAPKLHNLAEWGVDKCEWKSLDFVYTILDTVQFVCERGYQCIQMGSWQPLFHSGKGYEAWFDESKELLRLGKVFSHLEGEGVTEQEYEARLDKALEIGASIRDAMKIESADMGRFVSSMLSDLKMARTLFRARSDASASRPEPLGVLLFGGSSVMKSELATIMFTHYAKTFGLPHDDSYRYVRNFGDEYWSGFKSAKWCIHLDDVAPFAPQKMNQPDPSVAEMLQIVNSTAYVTNQAELEDKGKIPIRARLVTASTNTEHMNADIYYSNSLAIRRRLPFLVTVEIKECYRQRKGDSVYPMVDSSKIPKVEDGDYHDVWKLTVKKVIGKTDATSDKQYANTEVVAVYENIYDFLAFFSKFAREKQRVLVKAEEDREVMKALVLCKTCDRPEKHCRCPRVQGNSLCNLCQEPSHSGDCDRTCELCGFQDCACMDVSHFRSCKDCACRWVPCAIAAVGPGSDNLVVTVGGVRHATSRMNVRTRRGTVETLMDCEEVKELKEDILMQESDLLDEVSKTLVEDADAPWKAWIVQKFLSVYARHVYVQDFLNKALYYSWFRSVFVYFAVMLVPRPMRALYVVMGRTIAAKHRQHPFLCTMAEVAAGIGLVWCGMLFFRKKDKKPQTKIIQPCDGSACATVPEAKDDNPYLIGLARPGVTLEELVKGMLANTQNQVAPSIVPMEKEFVNQWALHDIKLADRPTSSLSVSWKGLGDDEIISLLKHNCVTTEVRFEGVLYRNKAFCLGGHCYLMNWHGWKAGGHMTVYFGGQGNGVEAKQHFECDKLESRRYKNSDLFYVKILGLPVRRDVRELFAPQGFDGVGRGFMMTRDQKTGEIVKHDLERMRSHQFEAIGDSVSHCFSAVSPVDLHEGDCGSPWIMRTPNGVHIVGLHYWQLTGSKEVGCVTVARDMVDELVGD
jgi:hypothetical protein